MSLPVYRPPTKAITFNSAEGDLTLIVRGLDFEDVTALVQAHLPDIVGAVEQYGAATRDVYSTRNMDGFLSSMLTGFPALVSHLIAHAANEPDEHAVIARYPIGVQMAALTAIAELTLEDAGGLEDPSPALGQAVRLVVGALRGRENPSLGSSGPSVAP